MYTYIIKPICANFIYLLFYCIYIHLIGYIYGQKHLEIYSIIHIIPALCILCLTILISGIYKNYLYYLIYIICITTGTIDITHLMLYGAEFNSESAYALLSTNKEESFEFVISFINKELSITLLIFIFASLFLTKLITKTSFEYNSNFKKKTALFLSIIVIYTAFSSLRNFRTPLDPYFPTKIIKKIITANKEIQLTEDLQASYSLPAKSTYQGSQTIVLIIGESATRRNMHLYGYPRQTTPHMECIDNLRVFTDVISSAPTTQKSIGRMLTMADLNGTPYTTTVFDIFNASGFKTFWLSAQFSGQSPGSGIVPILAQRANSLWSLKHSMSPDKHYDEYIIPQFIETFNDTAFKKLIVINILGSHTYYKERIPQHRNGFLFTDNPPGTSIFRNFNELNDVAKIINDYDTSIKYTDYVVSSIFESIDKLNHGAWVGIYLSDHGEEVFDTENRFGHAGSSTSRNVYEIPLVLKISNDYERWMRDAKIFTLDIDRPYQTDNLIHTLLNLAAIETALYDPKKSIVHPDFQIMPRWINGAQYTKELSATSAVSLHTSNPKTQAPPSLSPQRPRTHKQTNQIFQ